MHDERWDRLTQRVNEVRLVQAIRHFRSLGFEPLVIKGFALARFYPPGKARLSSDIDLAFSPKEFPLAQSHKNDSGIAAINLDLHCGLRWLDPAPFELVMARSETVGLDGEQIRVPAREDLFRIAAVHWLTDSGSRRDRLLDFRYLIESAKGSLDWNIAISSVGDVRRTWYLAVLAAARDYAGLAAGLLPEEVREYRPPDWFYAALEKEWRRRPAQRGKLSATWRHPTYFFPLLYRQLTESPIGQCILLDLPIAGRKPPFIRTRAFVRKLKREISNR